MFICQPKLVPLKIPIYPIQIVPRYPFPRYSSNASCNIPTSTSVQTTTRPEIGDTDACRDDIPPLDPPLSHKFQKLFRELKLRDCFPRAEESSNTDDVVFCRRYADAERNVGLDVALDDNGEECGERRGDSETNREWGVQGVLSNILSCEAERWTVGLEVGITGSEVAVIEVYILSWEFVRSRIEVVRSSWIDGVCGQADREELKRSWRREMVEVLLAVGGGVGNSLKNFLWRLVSGSCCGENGAGNSGVW
jgi:hypothetical protein